MKLIDCAIRIRELINVESALEQYGISFNNRGYAICPFHNEKTASFKVQNKLYWHCFGCGKSGDIIDYVIDYCGLKWSDAISKINTDFNLNLPIGRKQTVAESLQASRRQRELEQERADRVERIEQHERLLDTYAAFDCAAMRLKPKPGETKVNPIYLYALTQLEYYKWLIRDTPYPERG
jgi:DNA primase